MLNTILARVVAAKRVHLFHLNLTRLMLRNSNDVLIFTRPLEHCNNSRGAPSRQKHRINGGVIIPAPSS
jgi:hypothetical protein